MQRRKLCKESVKLHVNFDAFSRVKSNNSPSLSNNYCQNQIGSGTNILQLSPCT